MPRRVCEPHLLVKELNNEGATTRTNKDPGNTIEVHEKKAPMERAKNASQTHHRYLKATTIYQQLLSGIRHEEAYSWANNAKILERLERPMMALAAAMATDQFNKIFLLDEMLEVRAQYEDHDKKHERFNEIATMATQVEDEVNRFSKMHAASAR